MSADIFGDTHINAFGDTHINAFGDTHINAFGDTHLNAFGDTHINAFGVWEGQRLTHKKARSMVPVGPSESPWRTPSHETTHGASVEVEVGFNVVVCSRKGSGHFIARVARGTRRGCLNPNRR